MPATESIKFSREELARAVEACATDGILFSQLFFPKTTRQPPAKFHADMWAALENPKYRYVNLRCFRGAAKTSIARMYTAKCIAYGLGHTIIYVGKSEGHAIRSVKWLRRQVESNRQFADVFALRPGSKWQDLECEIVHQVLGTSSWIIGVGITGSIRGINIDDFRPHVIVLDDVLDEENCATLEQRTKISDLVYGALVPSLAPRTEAPHAKLVSLATSQHREDYTMRAISDPEWLTLTIPCWTEETRFLPIAEQESAWPERYPSEALRASKEAAYARNTASVWSREMECEIIAREERPLKGEWLLRYTEVPQGATVLAIDPVPPPSAREVARGFSKKHFEAIVVMRRSGRDIYLLEYAMNRGHEPTWTIAEFFRLAHKWGIRKACVEAYAYQRTLAWILRQGMQYQGRYYVVEEVTDRRSKHDRILDALGGLAAHGHLRVHNSHVEFIRQWENYGSGDPDDLLDAAAIGVRGLGGIWPIMETDTVAMQVPPLVLNIAQGAP